MWAHNGFKAFSPRVWVCHLLGSTFLSLSDPGDHLQQNNLQQCVWHCDLPGDHGGGVHREGAERQIQIQAASANPHRGYHGEEHCATQSLSMFPKLATNINSHDDNTCFGCDILWLFRTGVPSIWIVNPIYGIIKREHSCQSKETARNHIKQELINTCHCETDSVSDTSVHCVIASPDRHCMWSFIRIWLQDEIWHRCRWPYSERVRHIVESRELSVICVYFNINDQWKPVNTYKCDQQIIELCSP